MEKRLQIVNNHLSAAKPNKVIESRNTYTVFQQVPDIVHIAKKQTHQIVNYEKKA